MRSSAVAIGLATLLQLASAQAEVRLIEGERGELTLDVRPVAGLTWASRSSSATSVINPLGDVTGDGAPAHASSDGNLVGAWTRASSGSVVLLRASAIGQSTECVLASSAMPVGKPRIAELNGAWLVLLQTASSEPLVQAFAATATAVSAQVVVASGLLVEVLVVDEDAHVITFEPGSSNLVVTTLGVHPVPEPLPIARLLTRIDLRLSAASRASENRMLAAWSPCIEQTDDGYLLAWKTGDGFVGSVTLTAEGVGEPMFVRGPNGSCQATLNAADRE